MQLVENSRSEVGQERLQLNEDTFLFAGGKRETTKGMVRLDGMTSPGRT